jgi:cellobiose transport system permease protein
MRTANFRRNYYGYLFIAPFVIGFLVFGLYPIYNTFALSFTDFTLMSRSGTFIGLKNFERLFADDVFMKAVRNTWLIWTPWWPHCSSPCSPSMDPSTSSWSGLDS